MSEYSWTGGSARDEQKDGYLPSPAVMSNVSLKENPNRKKAGENYGITCAILG